LSSKPGQKRPKGNRRPVDVLRRPAVALPALLAVVLAVAGAVAVLASGDDARRPATSGTSPTTGTVSSPPTAPSGPTPTTTPSATGTTKAPATTTSTRPAGTDGTPAAPWLAPPVKRRDVPAPFVEAWERAQNRSTCALLVPSGVLPRMEGATPSSALTPQDRGWDILLRKEAGIIEILGLFSRADQPEDRAPASFTRRWSDGSELRYGPEAGGGPGVSADPEANPFEGVLTVPTQDCAYRVYDTLGLSHFELVVDRLRFVEGTT
jgi:hypothetical protein